MAIVIFGGMCRQYDDASGLLWRNVRFEADGSGYELSFDKRKNAQYIQDNKVLVASSPLSAMCPVRLLREMQIYTGSQVRGHERIPGIQRAGDQEPAHYFAWD